MIRSIAVKYVIIDIFIMALYIIAMFFMAVWYGATGPDGKITGLSGFLVTVRNYVVPAAGFAIPLLGTAATIYIYRGKRRRMHVTKKFLIAALFKIAVFLAPLGYIAYGVFTDGFDKVFVKI